MSDERKPVWEETYAIELPEPRHDEYAEMIGVVFASCECREHEQCVAAWVQPEHTDQPNCEGDYERRQQRAQLLSAAPDMARALLALEWSGQDRDCGSCCPSCEALGPSVFWKRKVGEPHLPDCALDAALRKAGVRT